MTVIADIDSFCVAKEDGLVTNAEIDPSLLAGRKLYKSLSLLLSKRARIPVPPSLLLLKKSPKTVEQFVEVWGDPLMIRMDFEELPKKKTLGGIPLYGALSRRKVSQFLFGENCVPLFHPHLDRFKDEHSVGIALKRGAFEAEIEVVGTGFDASDLRLGCSVPHESIRFDLLREKITRRTIIDAESYANVRSDRIKRAAKYLAYIQYANKEGILLPSLTQMSSDTVEECKGNNTIHIPEAYTALSNGKIRQLGRYAFQIVSDVLDSLPQAEDYVASFSFIPERGWILWDIYGAWYVR